MIVTWKLEKPMASAKFQPTMKPSNRVMGKETALLENGNT